MKNLNAVLICGLTAIVTCATATYLHAGKDNRGVEVGDQAPNWTALPATDGQTYGLDSFGDAKAIVVAFTCNNCPVAVAYQDRLMKLAADYKDQGVAMLAINVNRGEDLAEMKQRAEESGFNFPYIWDESQQSAREYGAKVTPHVFLLDGDRKVAYMGAIDNNWQDGAAAEKHYLRDAVDAVLSGQSPTQDAAKPMGCGIKWNN